MKFKIKCEPLGEVIKTNKGYIRQFLVATPDGKDVTKIYANDVDDLMTPGVHEREIETGEMVFAAKK